MIQIVDFISRATFESRMSKPNEAVISIGDHDQPAPLVLSNYSHGLRQQFLDIEPEDAWRHGLRCELAFQLAQATELAGFIRMLHGLPQKIDCIVHCEAGVSRSAAIALAIEAYANCDRVDRDACYANPHVVRLLSRELGVAIEIPPQPEVDSQVPFFGESYATHRAGSLW